MPDFDPVAEAEANLKVVTLERRLRDLKDDDPDGELAGVKLELREARQAYREMRETVLGEGDAVASPETVAGKVNARKAGK